MKEGASSGGLVLHALEPASFHSLCTADTIFPAIENFSSSKRPPRGERDGGGQSRLTVVSVF